MKYLKLFFISILSILGCSKEESPVALSNYNSLESISCECDRIEIVPFQQQWRLNFIDSICEVKVFGVVEHGFIFDEGTYEFDLKDTVGVYQIAFQVMKLNNRTFYYSDLTNGFSISDPGASCDKGASYLFRAN